MAIDHRRRLHEQYGVRTARQAAVRPATRKASTALSPEILARTARY